MCTSGSVVEYRLAKAKVAGSTATTGVERPPDVRLRRLVLSMIQKRDIRWVSLFYMFKPSRARTVRSPGSDLFIAGDIMCDQKLFIFSEKTSNF